MEKIFIQRLRQLRLEKGVTQKQMSRDLFMTDNYIYNIEAGIAYPSMAQFFGICNYFNTTPAEFLQFEPDHSAQEEALLQAVSGLDNGKLEQVIQFAKSLK